MNRRHAHARNLSPARGHHQPADRRPSGEGRLQVRARQINTYTQQLEDNQFEFFGPLVDSEVGEKSLGIALREIAEDKLEVIPGDVARARRAEAEEARRAAEADMFSDISLDSPVSLEGGETPTSLDDIQF